MARRVFRTTKVNLTQDLSSEDREKLEGRFIELEGYRKLAVEKARVAASVQADAIIARAQSSKSLVDFLSLAGDINGKVATEEQWFPPYKNKDGDIILECPMTLQDQRVLTRAAKASMGKQMEDIDDSGVFEDDDESDE